MQNSGEHQNKSLIKCASSKSIYSFKNSSIFSRPKTSLGQLSRKNIFLRKAVPPNLDVLQLIIKNNPEHYNYDLLAKKMDIMNKKYLNKSISNTDKKYYNYNILYGSKSNNIIETYSPKLRPRSSSLKEFNKSILSSSIEKKIFSDEEINLIFKKKCEDINVNLRLELLNRFNDFICKRCVNRIVDLSECNLSINSISALKYILEQDDRCSRLILARNNIGDKGVEILADYIEENNSLVYLDLSSNDIGFKGGDCLFKSLIYNTSIISLNLSSLDGINRNRICAEGTKFLTNLLKENKFLSELNLSGNSIKNEGLKNIIDGLYDNNSLITLILSNNEIDEKGIIYFNSIKSCKLSVLDLKENSIKNAGIEIIGKCLISNILMNVKELNISTCKITFEGIKKFFSIIYSNRVLNSITLNNNYFSKGKFEDLEQFISNMNLRYLGLSGCAIGKSFVSLANIIIGNTTLKGIDLSYNQIDDECFNCLSKLPKNNRILESIDLSKNFITEASAKNFFNNLNYNNSLKYINFHDNQMQNSIANIIINILRMNKTILKINLTANRIQLRMINEINKFLKRNASLEHEKFVPSLKENIKRLQFNPKELIELKKKIISNSNDRNILYQKVMEDTKKFSKQKEIGDKNLKELEDENNKYLNEIKKYENKINEILKEKEIIQNKFKEEANVIETKVKNLENELDIIKKDLIDRTIEKDLTIQELQSNIVKYQNDLNLMFSRVDLALKSQELLKNEIQQKRNKLFAPKKSESKEDKKNKNTKKVNVTKNIKKENEKKENEKKDNEKKDDEKKESEKKDIEKKENKKSRPSSGKKKKVSKSSSATNVKSKFKK